MHKYTCTYVCFVIIMLCLNTYVIGLIERNAADGLRSYYSQLGEHIRRSVHTVRIYYVLSISYQSLHNLYIPS